MSHSSHSSAGLRAIGGPPLTRSLAVVSRFARLRINFLQHRRRGRGKLEENFRAGVGLVWGGLSTPVEGLRLFIADRCFC